MQKGVERKLRLGGVGVVPGATVKSENLKRVRVVWKAGMALISVGFNLKISKCHVKGDKDQWVVSDGGLKNCRCWRTRGNILER